MFKKTLFTIIFISALLFQGCSQEEEIESANDLLSTKISLNEYILTSTDNEQFVVQKSDTGFILEEAHGKVIIFDIFATWCPPCQASSSHLASLQKKYKDDLVVIGITIEDNIPNTKLEDFKRKFGAKYIIVNSLENRRLINEIASELDLGARFPIPLMAMYKDGTLVNHYVGAIEEEFLESDIKKALGK